jgi:hypothetical protein
LSDDHLALVGVDVTRPKKKLNLLALMVNPMP